MPFVGAAIIPHSPLLLPTVGRDYGEQLKRTQRALKTIRTDLYALMPETVLFLHPHGETSSSHYLLALSDSVSFDFREFGDLVTAGKRTIDRSMVQRLAAWGERHRFPIRLTSETTLSHDVAVPLALIADGLPQTRVVPIQTANQDRRTHWHFGKLLADVLHDIDRRIFVAISIELSQHRTSAAPGGIRPEGTIFDETIVKHLGKKSYSSALMDMPADIAELAESCGLAAMLILAGFLDRKNVHFKKLSYESPFGIGLLVASITPA